MGGANQKICILDTGAEINFLNINSSQITSYNVLDGTNNITDTNGHGTSVSYVATEVAPEANFVFVKVVGSDGLAYASDILAGIDYCEQENANIISISLGAGEYSGYCDQDLVAQKINSLDSLVVVATGNAGLTGYVTSPSCASNALPIGASTKQDTLSSITNYNDATLLLAPGENINTINNQGNFVSLSGTSMSVPIVVGVAAIVLENQSLNSNQLKDLLVHTGDIITTPNRYFSRIDSSSALNQYVTNNLFPGNVSLVNGSEENFTLSTVTAYTNNFTSLGSGWTESGGTWTAVDGYLFNDDWMRNVIYRGSPTDDDYVVDITFSSVNTNGFSGFAFGLQDETNYYFVDLSSQSWSPLLALKVMEGGSESTIDSVSNYSALDTSYRLKILQNGSIKKVKFWLNSSSEPSNWDIDISDSTFVSGGWGFLARETTHYDSVDVYEYTLYIDPNVTATSFNGSSTNFSTLLSENVSNLVLEVSGNGKIAWLNTVNISNSNYDLNVDIGNGYIYVNSSALSSSHNSSANLTIESHGKSYPLVYKDGSFCSSCTVLSTSGGDITFNVTGFSNYTIEEGTNLSIYDDTDTQTKLEGNQITFYANYSNSSSNAPISGDSYYCEFVENGSGSWSSPVNMTFNTSSELYEYNKSFSSDGSFNFNVSCFSDYGDYANLTTTDTFLITPSYPIVQSVYLLPDNPNYNNELNGYCNATDANTPYIDYNWVWYLNGTEYSSGSIPAQAEGIILNLDTILEGNLNYFDNWTFSCSAFDGDTEASWVNASKVITSRNPSITLNTPTNYLNNTYYGSSQSVIFNCSTYDDYNLDNVSLYIKKDSGLFLLNQTQSVSGISDYANWSLDLTQGVYTWNCLAYDNDSLSKWSTNNFTYNLTFSPTYLTLSDTSDSQVIIPGDYILFKANYSNATDVITSSNTYCEFVDDGAGSWSSPVNMTWNSNFYYLSKNFSTSGVFNYSVSCFTDTGQLNLSDTSTFQIILPEINPPSGWRINFSDNFSMDSIENYTSIGSATWYVESGVLTNANWAEELSYMNLYSYNESSQVV